MLRSEPQRRERADVMELVVSGLSDISLIPLTGIADGLFMTAAHENMTISISTNVQSLGVSTKQRKLRSTCVNSGRTTWIEPTENVFRHDRSAQSAPECANLYDSANLRYPWHLEQRTDAGKEMQSLTGIQSQRTDTDQYP